MFLISSFKCFSYTDAVSITVFFMLSIVFALISLICLCFYTAGPILILPSDASMILEFLFSIIASILLTRSYKAIAVTEAQSELYEGSIENVAIITA